jgi:hypothetical protein
LQAAPDETVDGKPHSVIKLRSPNGIDVAVYIDKKTKLVTRMKYAEGASEEIDQFSNFKEVKGLKIAHSRQSGGAGRETKLDLKTVELDPKYDPKQFEKPATPPATPTTPTEDKPPATPPKPQ